MITYGIPGNGVTPKAKVHFKGQTNVDSAVRRDPFEMRMKTLTQMLNRDRVEISGEARVLSYTPRTLAAQNRYTGEQVPATKPAASSSPSADVDPLKTVEQAEHFSVESREDEGARLDAYLNELRKEYGEEEAMSRFTEYMRSEGYEIDDSGMKPVIGASTTTRPYGLFKNNYDVVGKFGRSYGENALSFMKSLNPQWTPYQGTNYTATDRSNANFTVHSTLNTTTQNGQTSTSATTWAQYDAAVSTDTAEVYDKWKQRNLDALSEQAGFDMEEYLNSVVPTTYTWGKAFAAESVNTDLASTINSILADAGVVLEPGQNIGFNFDDVENRLYANLNFGDQALRDTVQSAIDAATKKDRSILDAFKAESAGVEPYDLNQLEGSFDNGAQSNSYLQHRTFLLSGDEPSVMVMGSGLTNVSTGYVFRKKVSDTFDSSADVIKYSGKADTADGWKEQGDFVTSIMDAVSQQKK